MKEHIYRIKNLYFSFNKKPPYIIESANLEVRGNRLTAIVGINGSGKSTLLKLLINFLSPSKGDIEFMNKPLAKIPPGVLSKRVSYVGQNPNEEIPLTVEEVVNLGNFPYESFFFSPKTDSKKNLENAIEITKIERLRNKFFTNLSIGEKQKVMIARAACQNTRVILLDEPTSSLDIKNEVEIMKLLRILVKEKMKSVILISHNLNLVSQYADDIIFFDNGKIYSGENKNIFTSTNLSSAFNVDIRETVVDDKKIFY